MQPFVTIEALAPRDTVCAIAHQLWPTRWGGDDASVPSTSVPGGATFTCTFGDMQAMIRELSTRGIQHRWVDGTSRVLDALNNYRGDNLWEDVIYGLDYDEAATKAVEHGDGRDVVIGGVHYHYEQSTTSWRTM